MTLPSAAAEVASKVVTALLRITTLFNPFISFCIVPVIDVVHLGENFNASSIDLMSNVA